MDATETRSLIERAGGDRAFIRRIGLDDYQGIAQRVNNWKRRGIPPAVVLAHYEALQELRAEAAAHRARA